LTATNTALAHQTLLDKINARKAYNIKVKAFNAANQANADKYNLQKNKAFNITHTPESGTGTVNELLDPNKWTGAGALDTLSLVGDAASFIPGVGAIGGLVATGATLGSDLMRGKDTGEIVKNLGMNLGFTALSLLPGIGGATKLASKAALESAKVAHGIKTVEELAKIEKAANAVITSEKAVSGGIKTAKVLEAEKALEGVEKMREASTIAEKVVNTGSTLAEKHGMPTIIKAANKVASIANPNALGLLGTVGRTGLVGTGLYGGYQAGKQTIQDITTGYNQSDKEGNDVLENIKGGLGNISANDAKGLLYGVMAGKGLYNRALRGAGTNIAKGEINNASEVGSKVNLKGLPEGVNKEVLIKDMKNPKVDIDAHLDLQKVPKLSEIETLKTQPSPENEIKIAELTKQVDALEAAKNTATVDRTSSIKSKLGVNTTKEQYDPNERVLKTEVDPRSWYTQKFQQKAINKINARENTYKLGMDESDAKLKKLRDLVETKETPVTTKPIVIEKPIEVKPESIETKKVSQPQEDTIRKERKPLPEVSASQKKINKTKAKEAMTRLKDTGKIKPSLKQGGLIPMFQNSGILKFQRTPTNDYNPWESPLYKDDINKSNKANWIAGNASNATSFTYKAPALVPGKVLPEVTVVGKKSLITTKNPLVNTFIKPTAITPVSNNLTIPNIAEPIKYLAGQATNKQNLQTAIEHLTPVLDTPFQKATVDKNWLPIQEQTNRTAVETQRIASKPMTSNASLQAASNLEGATKANEIRTQGTEKAWGVQEENKQNANAVANENAQLRNATANKNLATMLAYRGVIGNLVAGKRMQDYANLTKFIDATSKRITDRNIVKYEYDINAQKQGLIDTYKTSLKPLQDKFDFEYGTSGENVVNTPEYKTWQEQQQGLKPGDYGYYSWESNKNAVNRDAYTNRMTELNRNLSNTQKRAMETYDISSQGLNKYYDPTGYTIKKPNWFPTFGNTPAKFKKGGSVDTITPGQKYEIEILKLKQKDKEHGDKNFQTTLDRTDKNTSKVLDGLSKEKLMLLKTVLGTK